MDKISINNRFIEAINYLLGSNKGLSKSDLAASFNIKNSKFSEILNYRMNVGTDLLAILCNRYNISSNWLLTGRGNMLYNQEQFDQEYIQTFNRIFEESIPKTELTFDDFADYCNIPISKMKAIYLRQIKMDDTTLSRISNKLGLSYRWVTKGEGNQFIEGKFNKEKFQKEYNSYLYQKQHHSNSISIPIVDISVAAGIDGYINSDYLDVIDKINLPISMIKSNAQYFCVRAKGDSMAPTILDSSYVILRLLEQQEWEYMPERQVYVVSDKEGRSYLKRIKNRLKQGFIVCMSDNVDKVNYPNFNLQIDEINCILHAEWYISAKMPNINDTYFRRLNELEDKYDLIENKLSLLLKK